VRRRELDVPAFLAKNRKYAILLCFVAAAILARPPDAFNQLLLAGPMSLLHEASIVAARLFGCRKPPAA
jgi:sec-independent protein translocase protein TatC